MRALSGAGKDKLSSHCVNNSCGLWAVFLSLRCSSSRLTECVRSLTTLSSCCKSMSLRRILRSSTRSSSRVTSSPCAARATRVSPCLSRASVACHLFSCFSIFHSPDTTFTTASANTTFATSKQLLLPLSQFVSQLFEFSQPGGYC